eukprot:1526863-Rhodomonas_salina.1
MHTDSIPDLHFVWSVLCWLGLVCIMMPLQCKTCAPCAQNTFSTNGIPGSRTLCLGVVETLLTLARR